MTAMAAAQEGIGQRIAAYRRRRGISQSALAGLIGRSESWLSQVERGTRSVDRLSVLIDLSEVLHVEVADLVGRPWRLAPNGGPLIEGLHDVRNALTGYRDLLGLQPNQRSMDAPHLEAEINRLHQLYQAADYAQVIARLPIVLNEVDQLGATAQFVNAYVLAAKLTTKLGAADMAWIAADRAATAAVEMDDPIARGLATYQVVCGLLRGHQKDHAEDLAVIMAERLDSPGAGLAQKSVRGSLLLIAAVIAARNGDRTQAWKRLRAAEHLAREIPRGANSAYTAFCVENVGIHRISVATELGNASEAIDEAEQLDLSLLPHGLRSRRSQVHLDLAWAEAHRQRDNQAVAHLLEASEIAPESLQFNSMARELVRELLNRGKAETLDLDTIASRAAILV